MMKKIETKNVYEAPVCVCLVCSFSQMLCLSNVEGSLTEDVEEKDYGLEIW